MMKVKLQYVILRQGMENQSRFSSYAGMKYVVYVCSCFDPASFVKVDSRNLITKYSLRCKDRFFVLNMFHSQTCFI